VVGAVIGNYQLVQKLGEGGMGAVYLGQHQLLGRRAAIKVLLPELSARPDIVNRFFNEARAVTSISDPGIVQVFDFGYHSDGSAFIVMEYLEGEPLDRRLMRHGRLTVEETMRLARQLAISLAAAHAQGIVHRDLKPENVFLVPDAEVASGERSKILDFGIAKLSDEHPGKLKTRTGTMMGTPTYMSPEQCRGLPDIDHRSDIYSLGCVLFHLLTGRPPFEGEAPGDIMAAHIREPAPAPSSRAPDVPPGVDALVLRCLAKAPADRFQSMGELTAAVAAVLPQLSVGAAAARPMPAMPVMPATMRMPAGGTPVPVAPGAGTGPSIPTTLGASAGQLAAVRTAPPGTPVPPVPRKRRVRLWITGGLIVAAAGIGIALVGAGSGGARVSSRPDPVTTEGAAPGAGPATANAPPANVASDAPASTNAPPAASAPAVANPPAAAVAPAAASAPAPADAADHASAAANGPSGKRDATIASGGPPPSRDPATEPGRTARDPVSGHDASKKPAHRKRKAAVEVAPGDPASKAPAAAAAPSAPAAAPPAAAAPSAPAASPPAAAAPSAPAAAPPAAAAPKPPEPQPAAKPGRCSKAVFAVVYNAAAPSKDAIRAAIRNLNACHTAGAISDADFDETQAALVARF
jgi:serine/threonine-protein kinase